MLRIIIEDSEGKSKSAQVDPSSGDITIGRKEGNFIRLKERNVSREHARIFMTEEGLFVEPVAARYGLKLNSTKIDGPTPLALGDEIRVGDYRLYLQDENQPDPHQQKDPNAVVDIPPEMQPRFVVISSNFAGRDYHMTKSKVVIGRNPACDIAIEHQSVSGNHAEVRRTPRGEFEIRDLGSSNGTKINGMVITEPYRLSSGDCIVFGHVIMRFCAPGDFWTLDFGSNEAPKSNLVPILVAVVLIVVILVGGGLYALSMMNQQQQNVPQQPVISAEERAKIDFDKKFKECDSLLEENDLEGALECFNRLHPTGETDRRLVKVKTGIIDASIRNRDIVESIDDALTRKDCNAAVSEFKQLSRTHARYDDLDKDIKICKIDYYFEKGIEALSDKDFDTANQNRDNLMAVKSGGIVSVDDYSKRKADQLTERINEVRAETEAAKAPKPSTRRSSGSSDSGAVESKPVKVAPSYDSLMEEARKASGNCDKLKFYKQAVNVAPSETKKKDAQKYVNVYKTKCK